MIRNLLALNVTLLVMLSGPPKTRLIFPNREVSKSWEAIA